jgi:uncharacterized secreted protein with C-terminal beta-propeller domain
MSGYKGDLRVATTAGYSDWGGGGTSNSYVTILRPRSGALVKVGQVGGLGHGEFLPAVRFVDDIGYVVTYQQTDPLYTVDLSDPTSPKVVGELKLLG